MQRTPLQQVPENVPASPAQKGASVEVTASVKTHTHTQEYGDSHLAEATGAGAGYNTMAGGATMTTGDLTFLRWRRQWRKIMATSVIYFDEVNLQGLGVIKDKLEQLGTRFQPFFDRSVTHVVTERPLDGRYPSGDVLSKAASLSMRVWSASKFERFCNSLLGSVIGKMEGGTQPAKLWQMLQREKYAGTSESTGTTRKDEFLQFRGSYILIWDPSQVYRPILHKIWTGENRPPRLRSSPPGLCPFLPENAQSAKRKRAEQDAKYAEFKIRAKRAAMAMAYAAEEGEEDAVPETPVVQAATPIMIKPSCSIVAPVAVSNEAVADPKKTEKADSQFAQVATAAPSPTNNTTTVADKVAPESVVLPDQSNTLEAADTDATSIVVPVDVTAPSQSCSQSQQYQQEQQIKLAPENAYPLIPQRAIRCDTMGRPADIVASGIQRYSATSAVKSIATQSGEFADPSGFNTSREVASLQRQVLPPIVSNSVAQDSAKAVGPPTVSRTAIPGVGESMGERRKLGVASLKAAYASLGNMHPSMAMPAKATTKAATKVRQQGYCENCLEKYECLEEHVESSKHRRYAQGNHNFGALDEIISQLQRIPAKSKST